MMTCACDLRDGVVVGLCGAHSRHEHEREEVLKVQHQKDMRELEHELLALVNSYRTTCSAVSDSLCMVLKALRVDISDQIAKTRVGLRGFGDDENHDNC